MNVNKVEALIMKTKIPFTLCCLMLHSGLVIPVGAQSTLFTYQGRVLDNGTNFNGAGQFKFTLVTSTNTTREATATANLSGSFVTSYTVTDGGNGYSIADRKAARPMHFPVK
jgi:hypothetical protein